MLWVLYLEVAQLKKVIDQMDNSMDEWRVQEKRVEESVYLARRGENTREKEADNRTICPRQGAPCGRGNTPLVYPNT